MKTNFEISQFSWFLLRSGYSILVYIWKWPKLLNSVPFIKKIRGNHVYIQIWSFWWAFTVLQWMKTSFKHLVVLLAGPISHTSTRCMDFVEIFNIILDLSITCFSHFSGCWASFMFIVITLSWNAITCFLESSWVWDRFLLFQN